MIAFVRGIVDFIEEETLIIDLGSVAVSVLVPMSMLEPRPIIGEEILLHTHLQVREDGWQLFGFTDKEQLRIFRLLQSVSGVGAKTALSIIDKLPLSRFATAVTNQDSKVFTEVSGVGRKTAERILLELKDKFPHLVGEESSTETSVLETTANDDLLYALKQLGYSATEARTFTIKAQIALGNDALPEELLREALKIAMKT